MKIYVTFGQEHKHYVNGKVFDKDCVAVIESQDAALGRKVAFEVFDGVFATTYREDQFTPEILKYFPRGLISLEGS